jgi:lysophospholipase L1-like esterase
MTNGLAFASGHLMRHMVFALAVLATAAGAARAELKLRANDRVVIAGDSIATQHHYTAYLAAYLLMCQPAENLRVITVAQSGDTAWGFYGRTYDAARFKPDVVVTCFGMNDGGYVPPEPATLNAFREGLLNAVADLQKSAGPRRMFVGSSIYVDPEAYGNGAADYNNTLALIRDIARETAAACKTDFVDLHGPMRDALYALRERYPDYKFGGKDGFHPSRAGHLVMAYEFLVATGCDGKIGSIQWDVERGVATASAGHRVIASSKDEVALESRRYPFCFTGPEESADATRGVLHYLPFNQKLNRFELSVGGAAGKRWKLTWGVKSKVFDGAELERGINLAAEFADETPFHKPFARVEQAIREQQKFETWMVQAWRTLGRLEDLAPDEKDALKRAGDAAARRAAALADETAALVGPVRHVLRIEEAKP